MALIPQDIHYSAVFQLHVRDHLWGMVLTQDDIREARTLWDQRNRWGTGMESLDDLIGSWAASDHEKLYEVRVFMGRPWRGRECSLDDICMYAARRKIDPEPLMRMAYWMGEFRNPLMEFIRKD